MKSSKASFEMLGLSSILLITRRFSDAMAGLLALRLVVLVVGLIWK